MVHVCGPLFDNFPSRIRSRISGKSASLTIEFIVSLPLGQTACSRCRSLQDLSIGVLLAHAYAISE